ncbi:MAG TPA: sugar ABC transporter ATP-binding protein [Trebonia sp.]|nr:sugar ABC transporter ATP-binding protein [Trebonia sp.]
MAQADSGVQPRDGAAGPRALEISGVSKSYGSVPVLTDIDLTVNRGQVLGLLGSNGAGKSTLLNIIAGSVPASSGTISFDGQALPVASYGVSDAAARGVACVYQELSLFPNLTVAENFRMARPGDAGRTRRQASAATRNALRAVFPDCGIAPRSEVSGLSIADQQTAEIGIVASRPGLSVLILDEPTSALSREAARHLREYALAKAAEGVAVIYVTHKLDEVLDLCERIVVLRDGHIAWDGARAGVSREQLLTVLGAKEIGGREAAESRKPEPADASPDVILRARAQRPEPAGEIPIEVRAGEVVGLAGLEDAGQRQFLRTVYSRRGGGSSSRGGGSARRDGGSSSRGGAGRHRVDLRGTVAYVTGDRQREGVFALWDVRDNILVSGLRALSRWGWIRARQAREVARHWSETLSIVTEHQESPIVSLSGGNQQKALIARGLASGARLLLLDDPTRGIDIGTKSDFYGILGLVREQGRSALLYSTEDREFLECDRVYVMAAGQVVRELRGAEISVPEIIRWSYSRPASAAPGSAAEGDTPGSAAKGSAPGSDAADEAVSA